jgi:hypothetical protein
MIFELENYGKIEAFQCSCGSDSLILDYIPGFDSTYAASWQVKCRTCLTSGKESKVEAIAIIKWNKQHQPDKDPVKVQR